MLLRNATAADAKAILAIYNYEVEHSSATFDLIPRTLTEQEDWIREREGALGAIVAEVDGTVVGFASLSPYRTRPAYRTTVENSVYVAESARGNRVGKTLLEELVSMAEHRGFHTVIAHIGGEQSASVALHQACGFEPVGVLRQVGRKFGRWMDVVVMQFVIKRERPGE